jgi:hypothetical protein
VKSGIEFKVVWSDQDVSQLRVKCSNSGFFGDASIYVGHNDVSEMAEALSGFPSQASDTRNFELGTFAPNSAGGGIRLHFYCWDSVGHAAVDVKLRGDACMALGEVESVALRIPVEAAAIDSFLTQARGMDTNEISATACLHMAS